jgi:predicted ATP-dependent endonuclease of OLD family
MYISKIEITNIKGIPRFTMDLGTGTLPGWHVLIGDNGSGKTTILRCLAMAMLEDDFLTVYNMEEFKGERWLGKGGTEWELRLSAAESDAFAGESEKFVNIKFVSEENETNEDWNLNPPLGENENMVNEETLNFYFGFAAGYGPFRLLAGSDISAFSSERLIFFRTLFSESEGFEQTNEWLKGLKLDEKLDEIERITSFINTSGLLPEGVTLTDKIGSQGIAILDAAGVEINFRDAAAGFRSILSLTLDLIKNLISYYGVEKFMQSYYPTEGEDQFKIHLPGVVLIDEVDAHLHPKWQVRIGEWFTSHFPAIQFIVTTHSPLICRAAETGTIWRLATPGLDEEPGQVIGTDLKRLIYGDILDAYGTELFGEKISASSHAEVLRQELLELQEKSMDGKITDEESLRLNELRSYL